MIVLTDSMKGTFDAGSLIICKTADPEDIQVGDIICFYDPAGNGTTTVTHRVTQIGTDATGNLTFITKGEILDPTAIGRISHSLVMAKGCIWNTWAN